jgi:hypothetical protein
VKAVSDRSEQPRWAIVSPTNKPAVLEYGDPRPIAHVAVTINNFDFDHGNFEHGDPKRQKVFRVEVAGRTIDFEWRAGRDKLRRLVEAELIATTSFVTFSFDSRAGASENDLWAFARNVSTLCSWLTVRSYSFATGSGRAKR